MPAPSFLASIAGSVLAYITGIIGGTNVLTANLVPSAGTATTWQWTRNGTNISGQTASTYTQVPGTDAGATIGVVINGTYVATVKIPGSPVTQALRFISPTNAVATSAGAAVSGTALNTRFRMPFLIGSGDVSGIKLRHLGFALSGTGGNPTALANGYSIVKMAVESSSLAVVQPVTYGGVRTATVTPGTAATSYTDSDMLLPSAFGLTKFTMGETYYVRGEVSVSAAGQLTPIGSLVYTNNFPAAIGLVIDPATTTASAVDATGNMAQGNGSSLANPPMPLIMGNFVTGDPKTFVITGDSLVAGQNDTTNAYKVGSQQRGLYDNGALTNPIAGCKIAVAGTTASWWAAGTNAGLMDLLNYGNRLIEEFGTNVWLSTTTTTAAAAFAQSKVIHDAWRALGNTSATILKPKITPRTTSTDNWATTANQSFLNAAFAAGGNARAFNDYIDAQLAAGNIGVTIPLNAVRAGTDQTTDAFYQVVVNGSANYATPDGTHWTPALWLQQATEYRAAITAMA